MANILFRSESHREGTGPALPKAFWPRLGKSLDDVERGTPLGTAIGWALYDCQNLLCDAVLLWDPCIPDKIAPQAWKGKQRRVDQIMSPREARAQGYLDSFVGAYRGEDAWGPMLPTGFGDKGQMFVESSSLVDDTVF